MLTRSGFYWLVTLAALFGWAILLGQPNVALIASVLLLWMAFEAVLFAYRVRYVLPRLELERSLAETPAETAAMWANRPAKVVVTLRCRALVGLPRLRVGDRLPGMGECSGPTSVEGPCAAGIPLRLEYTLRCPAPGRMRFEGLSVELADLHGLFHYKTFLHRPVEATVLPSLAREQGWPGTVKRFNVLPAHGVHRYRRPGSGSELLDLREYVPGDPPRNIAWKVSARRDRLMTKEYESEVPVRCTLFVDVSDSVRVGPPGRTPLVRSIGVAAALAQQLTAQRDPVGVCLFDGSGSTILPPATGRRHLLRIHAKLADAAASLLGPSECPAERLIEPAYRLCQEVYPELLAPTVNKPGTWWDRLPSLRLPRLVFGLGLLGAFAIGLMALLRPGPFDREPLLLLAAIAAFVSAAGLLVRMLEPGLKTPRRQLRRARKQLSTILAARYGLGPGGISLLVHHDGSFAELAQRILLEHRVDYWRPLYGKDGRYLFAAPEKIEVLRKLLLRAVAHGQDNELFVLLVDLLELSPHWGRLLQAIKVALARRHQVMVLCPWPFGLPMPTAVDWPDEQSAATDPLVRRFFDPARAVRWIDLVRFRQAYRALYRELERLQVPLVCTAASDSVDSVLRRIEHLRAARIRAR